MSAAAALPPAGMTQSRSARQMKRWRVRSRRVALFRKLLPATILAILIAMGGWIIGRTLLPPSLAAVIISEVMPNPRFFDQDSQGRPFVISALKGMRNAATDKTVILSEPSITLAPAHIGAQTAAYHQDTGVVTLQGEVVFDDGAGSKLTTDQAIIDTKTGVLRGSQMTGGEVRGVTPMGEFRADSYEIVDRGKTLRLDGNVRGRFGKAP